MENLGDSVGTVQQMQTSVEGEGRLRFLMP